MEQRQLEYVVALAEEQHFTRAAERCRVSQSGLSAAIRRLEDEVGTRLFERTTRSVRPTEAGAALLPHAREMLAQAAAARDAVVRASQQLAGALRVGAEQCLGVVDVNAALDRFHRRHPGVEIHFVQAGSHQLARSVETGDLDLAFVAATAVPASLAQTELGRRPLVLLCPADHPLAGRASIGWDELPAGDSVDFLPSWAMRTLSDAAFRRAGVERSVRCSVDDVHTLIDLVRRGFGPALVPQHVAQKPDARTLHAVALPPAPDAEWVVSAVVTSAPSLAAQLFELMTDAGRDEETRAA